MTVYRTVFRPPMFGAMPPRLWWEWHRPPADLAEHFPDKEVSKYPYGEFVTERPLTEKELSSFQIEVVEDA